MMNPPSGLFNPNKVAQMQAGVGVPAGAPIQLTQLSKQAYPEDTVRELTVDEAIRKNIAELHESIKYYENLYEEARRLNLLNVSFSRLRSIVGA